MRTLLILILTAASLVAGDVAYLRDFTPTSNVVFTDDGGFAIGMEAFYPKTSPVDGFNCSRKTFKVPADATDLIVHGGSISLRPPAIRNGKAFATDGLFRVYLGSRIIINIILKSDMKPENISVGAFRTKIRESEDTITVEFALAGASEPTSAEMQIAGEWESHIGTGSVRSIGIGR